MRYLVLFLLLLSPGVRADDTPAAPTPLACPQCGTWQILGSSGTSGESIVITPDHVTLPSMGAFCAQTVKQALETDPDTSRHYRVALRLSASCAATPQDAWWFEMDIAHTDFEDGSEAHIAVRASAGATPVFTAIGWNNERGNPCDSGRGNGMAACGELIYALDYKRLAFAAYGLQRSLPRPDAQLFARRFNPAGFAIAVAAFCDRYGTHGAGGGWSAMWSQICQSERITAKLHELEAFQSCRRKQGARCAMPGQRFSRKIEPDE